ncbi:MAG: T9SS type B sorting domain-containing protein, partial [Flavobacterium sp.]
KIIIPPVCDDFLDTNGNNTTNNNNRDGIATFDLTSSQAIIQEALPTTDTYNINYYKNRPDALAELNAITNITNYRNIGYRDSQDIWVRVESNIDNSCFALGPFLNLVVEMLPIANAVTIPRQCDDNQDGIVTFNTSSLEAALVKHEANVKVTYFDQNAAPLKDSNGVLITSPFPANFSTTSQTIKAVLTNNSTLGCSDETTIAFIVDASPSAFSIPAALTTACDDELNPVDQDGKFAFDTALFEATILGDQTGMTVSYFDQNGTKLDSPLPNPFVTGTQNISVSVENAENAVCIATTIIPFVVNRIPNIDLNLDGMANELVCSNLPSFFVTLDAGILDNASTSDYNYIWKKDGIDLTTDSPTLGVNNVGVYTVEVINNSGCSRTRTITVNASNVATVDSIDIIDLTDTNSITVNTTGPGDYEYSLDDSANFWQDSNFFDNVSAGAHIVFINDKNGCGIITREIVVVGIPKYFTPNNDSFNDGWGIKGMTKYPNATINIFDRYGKQITTLTISNQTWDGTSNGKPLPTSDYWYVITLDKNSPTIRGHFSLKR